MGNFGAIIKATSLVYEDSLVALKQKIEQEKPDVIFASSTFSVFSTVSIKQLLRHLFGRRVGLQWCRYYVASHLAFLSLYYSYLPLFTH